MWPKMSFGSAHFCNVVSVPPLHFYGKEGSGAGRLANSAHVLAHEA